MATTDLKTHLTEVAEAIRIKRGHDNLLSPQDFVEEILEIETGVVLQDKTVTPTTSQQTVVADSDYDGLGTVTVNAMPTATQATPIVSIDSNGSITATATQAAGYVVAGTKTSTKQLAFQAAKTITPTTVDQIAVSSGYYTGGNVTVAGDSNLVAGNIKSGVNIFGVTGTYEGGGSGGNTDVEDGLITRQIVSCTNDRITSIGSYAFASCSSLTSVSFPACKTIGGSAFHGCSRLTSVNFPACKTIDWEAFKRCSKLTSVNFPACTSISNYAFDNCSSLTSVNFPACTTISNYAFNYCSSLTSVSFPACTTINRGAFHGCSRLTSVSFPACKTINWEAFYGCSRLTSIYLMASSLCTLTNSNAFSKAGIWSTKGSIFVPSSLVASYKKATNWVFFSNRIFGI